MNEDPSCKISKPAENLWADEEARGSSWFFWRPLTSCLIFHNAVISTWCGVSSLEMTAAAFRVHSHTSRQTHRLKGNSVSSTWRSVYGKYDTSVVTADGITSISWSERNIQITNERNYDRQTLFELHAGNRRLQCFWSLTHTLLDVSVSAASNCDLCFFNLCLVRQT